MKPICLFIVVLASISCYAQKRLSFHRDVPTTAPMIFAEGVISVGDYESHADFSVGGDTVMFVKSGPDVSKWTICYSINKNGKWSVPEVAPFSGQYMDADPFFTPDGKTLYFISNRPLKEGDPAKGDMDIWKIEKTKNGWGKPVRLSDVVNSDASEYYPTMTSNGTLYFGSRRAGGKGGSDIYRSVMTNGEYTTPVNLGDAINTEGSEYEPYIAPDESFVIFMAASPDDLVNADLFISYNRDGVWTKAEKLPEPLNSAVTEFSPKVTKDGRYFFFASARNVNPATTSKRETMADVQKRLHSAGNGLCDIYFVDVAAVKSK
jgi:Tol biopolymer transport system component